MSEKSYVPSGAILLCDKGTVPTQLTVTSAPNADVLGSNAATELDKAPIINVKSFGLCAATRSPCMPAPLFWNPVKGNVLVHGARPLLENSKLRCAKGGCISIHLSLAAANNALAALGHSNDAKAEDAAADEDEGAAKGNGKGKKKKSKGFNPLGFATGVAKGAWGGLVNDVKGVGNAVQGGVNAIKHPKKAFNNLREGARKFDENVTGGLRRGTQAAVKYGRSAWKEKTLFPRGAVKKVNRWTNKAANAAKKQYNNFRNLSSEEQGKRVGEVGYGIGSAFVPVGKLGTVGKVGKWGKRAEKAAEEGRIIRKGFQGGSKAGEELEEANALRRKKKKLSAKEKSRPKSRKVSTGASPEEKVSSPKRDAAAARKKRLESRNTKKKVSAVEKCAGAGKCPAVGHPVDASNGMVFTYQTDFHVPGPVPLIWERIWYSSSTHRGPLGHGWHHRYDLGLAVAADGQLALRMADGRLASFAAPGPEGKSFNRLERLEAERTADGAYRVWDLNERVWYVFATHPARPDQVLTAVENAHGFALRLHYSSTGQLHTLVDSAGRRLDFQSDAGGRLLAVTGPHPDRPAERITLAQYLYDEAGNLATAADALGYAMQFGYDGHLLVQETNRVGLNFRFRYDGLDHTARCVHTWGDGGIYDTKISYVAPDLTVVTDSLGAVTRYTHAQGVATLIEDPLGGITQRVHNRYRELEIERNPLGQATLYDYDARGNQIQVTYANGARLQTAYNEYNLPKTITDPKGNVWENEYDERGNLRQTTDPAGAVMRYAYSERGQLLELTDPLGHATRLRYDAQHLLAHLVDANGHIRSRSYDALGRLIGLTDAVGAVQRRRYDLLGRLVALREPDGREIVLAYDGEGNVVRARNGEQEVEMTYVGLSRLATRRQAGTELRFHYDPEGRLTGIDNEAGEPYRFELDANGLVTAEQGFDGIRRRYERDAAGRVAAVHRPAGRATAYAYDAVGRVTAVRYDDGTDENFAYDAAGLLHEARNEAGTVVFERDALGRVVKETQGHHAVEFEYDARGQRTRLRSSLGAAFEWAHDALGNVETVRAGEHWHARFQHDARGLELQRTLSGGLSLEWQRDAAGRPTRQRVAVGTTAARQRHYRWQGADQLVQLDDSLSGITHYQYDARGYLVGARYADGNEDVRVADAVGNLFRSPMRHDRRYGAGGQLREANGTRYRYDDEGNLVRKTTAGEVWHYEWNRAGRLAAVKLPNGYRVAFAYDALGRRVRKRYRGQATHWVWNGDVVLHEWRGLEVDSGAGAVQDLATWLFEDGSFAPAAKLTAEGPHSVVCDHLGTPLELYDAKGTKTWQAQLDGYGAVREGKGRPQDCPFRYPGQYEDVETGLYYNRFRYYDPEAGYYISQDPTRLNGGASLYAYVHNPSSWLDPFGLEGEPEIYYRTLKLKHFKRLERTGRVPGTGETSTTRIRAYAEQYDGVTVEFKMKPGTTEALEKIGVSDGTEEIKRLYPTMPQAGPGWGDKNARYKFESGQVTTALGKEDGAALNLFNEKIDSYNEISRRQC